MSESTLPACRHRSPELQAGQWHCRSSRIVIPGGVVTAEVCTSLCFCIDHEPDPALDALVQLSRQKQSAAALPRWRLDQLPVEPCESYLAIAILTAPRPVSTISDSLQELRQAGFTQPVHLFAEPGSEIIEACDVVPHWNETRLGIWANWWQAARWLLEHTKAPFLMICEDDIRLSADAALGLQHAMQTLPVENWGYASLYTPAHNISIAGQSLVSGWQALDVGHAAWGALAYCFTREALQELSQSSHVQNHATDRHTDTALSGALKQLGRECYFHVPSLCEHTGPGISSVGHIPLAGSEAVAFDPDGQRYVSSAAWAVPAQSTPLVSCLMPTGNRTEFALQAVRYFQRQTYPERELIIVDDGEIPLQPLLPDDARIRYLRVPPGLSIGVKRNLTCEYARGEFLVQWDDDDWHGPYRLAAQVGPLIRGEADITAFEDTLFFHLPRWEFWCCSEDLHRRMFLANVHGGTLAFRRSVWQPPCCYPDQSLAEDARFLSLAVNGGARLLPLTNAGHFIYVRHGRNVWQFAFGAAGSPDDWWQVEEVALLAPDREFFQQHSLMLNSSAGAI